MNSLFMLLLSFLINATWSVQSPKTQKTFVRWCIWGLAMALLAVAIFWGSFYSAAFVMACRALIQELPGDQVDFRDGVAFASFIGLYAYLTLRMVLARTRGRFIKETAYSFVTRKMG